jgi:hypothetical protein
MKKPMIILVSIALVLIVVVVGLLAWFYFKLNPEQEPAQPLEEYIAQHWQIFSLKSWNSETGALELEYPLRFTYAQMEKYGGTMEELQDIPIGNLDTVESLKTAAREAAKVNLRAVTVYGVTTDGQVAYTVSPDGSITACWDE